MPVFKTTKNILTTPWEDELFTENWNNLDTPYLPPKTDWDYSRELKIEDVNISSMADVYERYARPQLPPG